MALMRRQVIQPTTEHENSMTKDVRAKLSEPEVSREKMKRPDDEVLKEELDRKILRTYGESRGEITKTLLVNGLVINHENKMTLSTVLEWE